ncbi:MAG: tetratricopeptide repeat protein [Acidobacteriota bacterium]|nr:tetratricopeptide repeat protein [Acidobacteriota bacterium]
MLDGLNEASREFADSLKRKRPKEEPKGIVRRAYVWLGAAWGKTLKAITAIVILALLIGGVVQQYEGRNDVMLDRFKVPSDLEGVGYSPEVVATKLADNIRRISDNAVSHVGSNIGASATTSVGGSKGGVTASKDLIRLQTFTLAKTNSPLDIEVPQTRVTVKSIFQYLFESLGVKPRRIDGEITSRGELLTLTVRITENGDVHTLTPITESTGDTEALLAEGARAIYRDIQPVVLASYLYSSGPAETPAAKDLIQDCIYQNKEAALANVLWGIILLNESKYDDALRKFDDAQAIKHEPEIDDILVSCRARAWEGKGNYEAADKIYSAALKQKRAPLTLTNYAGYLANRGYAEDALERYREVIRAQPDSDIAHSGAGYALERLGSYEKAEAEYREAIRLNPKSSNGYSSLALTLVSMKRYDEAVRVARKAVQVEENSANAHNTLGYVLQSTGRYADAVAEFERAVARNPFHTHAYLNWADALLNLRKYDEAVAKAKRALEIDANSEAAHSELALILINKKDFKAAVEQSKLAVGKDRSFVQAYDNWVTALLGQKSYEEAVATACDIVYIAPESGDAHNILGYAFMNIRKYDEAEREFEQAARLNPSNTYVLVNWAATLADRGKLKEAEDKAKEAVAGDGASADALIGLGSILRRQEKYDEALAVYEAAMRVNRQNVYSYTGWVEAMINKAESYEDGPAREELYAAAEQKAAAAVALDPLSVDALNSHGLALSKLKRREDAIAEHKKAAALDPHDVYGQIDLSQIYLDLVDNGGASRVNIDKAFEAARAAVAADSQSADAHQQLGFALNKKGDYALNKKDYYAAAAKEFEVSNPDDLYTLVGWARALRGLGDYAGAEEKARQAVSRAPNNSDARDELNAVLQCMRRPPAKCD